MGDLLQPGAAWQAGVLAGTGLFARQRSAGRAYRPKLLGFDVLLDAELQPWLVEIQRDPGQTGEGPVNQVNGRLFQTMFEMMTATVGSDDPAAIRAAERDAELRARRLRPALREAEPVASETPASPPETPTLPPSAAVVRLALMPARPVERRLAVLPGDP